MRFEPTALGGAWLIDLERHVDARGAFARSFCEKEFSEHGLPVRFPQCNLSMNTRAGTLRGMHYNVAPHGESKVVRCVRGAIHDVIVDIRRGSPSRLQWFGVELTADNGRALFVPAGFAHGFVTLADETDVYYHMGDFYRPEAARLPLERSMDRDPVADRADDHLGRGRRVRGSRPGSDRRLTESLVDTPGSLADELMVLIDELYPICRSITGDGVRETLAIVGRTIGDAVPLTVHEVPSGTPVLDWVVPPEWNIRDAYVANSAGERVIDFRRSNLHVVSYSVPVRARMTLAELRPHLHSLPDRPDLVPYRTSYYEPTWGFCVSQSQLDALTDDEYEVFIDSTLAPGSLTYGELVVPGRSDEEILISAHVCHPSLCDDNLTGVAVSAVLARELLANSPSRHTFRFVFAPGTIGAITWLARNRYSAVRIAHGLTLTCLGDTYPFTYKRTQQGDAPVDRCASYVLSRAGLPHDVIDFFPYGYDERQYNSPGFRIPVGSLMRGRHGQFPEYHTSGDNLEFVQRPQLVESFEVLSRILTVADRDRTMVNLQPYGEPQLGTRGLYGALGGTDIADAQLAMLWVLNLSDGRNRLLDIAERSGIEFDSIEATARLLEEHGLLEEVPPQRATPSADSSTGCPEGTAIGRGTT